MQRADYIIDKLERGQFKYPRAWLTPKETVVFHKFIADHAHMPPRGSKYHEQYEYILNLWKEHNMTPLQAATNKRDVLVAERDKNRGTLTEFREATITLSRRNAVINTEVLNLNTTIAVEQAKERDAKHRAMADELRAAGYRVGPPVTGSIQYPQIQQVPKRPTERFFVIDPCFQFLGTDKFDGVSQATYNSIKQMFTDASGGGKGGSVTSPVAAEPASAKLGGVHGVGEGWYSPVVYDSQGVKLNHDFAINTRDHHEARNQWWLKHVPTGAITKGFPNEAEAVRWIKGRMAKRTAGVKHPYYAPLYTTFDPHPEVK